MARDLFVSSFYIQLKTLVNHLLSSGYQLFHGLHEYRHPETFFPAIVMEYVRCTGVCCHFKRKFNMEHKIIRSVKTGQSSNEKCKCFEVSSSVITCYGCFLNSLFGEKCAIETLLYIFKQ
jgi:hypothetical protein